MHCTMPKYCIGIRRPCCKHKRDTMEGNAAADPSEGCPEDTTLPTGASELGTDDGSAATAAPSAADASAAVGGEDDAEPPAADEASAAVVGGEDAVVPPPPPTAGAQNYLLPSTTAEWKADDAVMRFVLEPHDLKDLPCRSVRNPGKPYPDEFYNGATLLERAIERHGGVDGFLRKLKRRSMCYAADPLNPPSTRYIVLTMAEDQLRTVRLQGGRMLVSSSAHVSKLTQCFQEAETVIILFAPKNFRGFKTWGQMTTVPEAGYMMVDLNGDTYASFRDLKSVYKDQGDAFYTDAHELPPDLGAVVVSALEAAVAGVAPDARKSDERKGDAGKWRNDRDDRGHRSRDYDDRRGYDDRGRGGYDRYDQRGSYDRRDYDRRDYDRRDRYDADRRDRSRDRDRDRDRERERGDDNDHESGRDRHISGDWRDETGSVSAAEAKRVINKRKRQGCYI